MVVPLKPELADRANPTDATLVAAARNGERWASEALYRRHSRMVNGLVFRLHPRDGDLDDIVQDVFVIALESLHKIQNPQAFASFIGSIAVRTTLKRIRRRSIAARLGLRPREPVDVEQCINPSASPETVMRARLLYAQLEALPTEERVAIVLRKIEGMALEEVAEKMGLSLATVKRRLQSAEARLRERGVIEPDE